MPDLEYQELMEPVARALLGEPNERLSKPDELRFGTHGSVAVDLARARSTTTSATRVGACWTWCDSKAIALKPVLTPAKWLEHAGFVQGAKI